MLAHAGTHTHHTYTPDTRYAPLLHSSLLLMLFLYPSSPPALKYWCVHVWPDGIH